MARRLLACFVAARALRADAAASAAARSTPPSPRDPRPALDHPFAGSEGANPFAGGAARGRSKATAPKGDKGGKQGPKGGKGGKQGSKGGKGTKSRPLTPTLSPSLRPTGPTASPTLFPSTSPTVSPSASPTQSPTTSPTLFPSTSPTVSPSASPTQSPTMSPSASPTTSPTTSPSQGPTPIPTGVCLTEAACDARRRQLGFADADYLVGDYPAFGCFEKNGVAYWGRGGTEEQVGAHPLSGEKFRIFCPVVTASPTAPPSPSPTAPNGVCLTEAACDARRRQLGVADADYLVGNHPTFGCFEKNGRVYWGRGGTDEEMGEHPLSGEKERIFCASTERGSQHASIFE